MTFLFSFFSFARAKEKHARFSCLPAGRDAVTFFGWIVPRPKSGVSNSMLLNGFRSNLAQGGLKSLSWRICADRGNQIRIWKSFLANGSLFKTIFFWASKRKKIENTAHRCIFFLQFSLMKNFFSNSAKNKALNHSNVQLNWTYPFGLYSSTEKAFILRCGNPLGIGCTTETIHTVLHHVQLKVFDRGNCLDADFGRRNIQQRQVSASKSAVLSLLLSLHKQRK
jgi:hypothetical protein